MSEENQPVKRGRGAPLTGHKTERIFPSLPKETVAYLNWRVGNGGLSAYLNELIKADPRYEEWKQTEKEEEK